MLTTVLIASNKVPCEGKQEQFMDDVKEIAREFNCEVKAIYGTKGPGCYNYAIKLNGERWEEFADMLTMILMPSRWTTTNEVIIGFSLTGLDH